MGPTMPAAVGPPSSMPTVQLLHELADGTSHVDWLIAQDPHGDGPLVTFRLEGRVDELAQGAAVTAQRRGDHRAVYLEYEGPVPGNRGKVRRLAKGVVVAWERRSEAWRIEVAWDSPGGTPRCQRLRLTPLAGGESWRVEAEEAASAKLI